MMRNIPLILWTLVTPGNLKGINARLLSSEKTFPKDDPVLLDHQKAQDKEQQERRLDPNGCPAMDPSNNCKKDVFIIGAGMAGVAAARELSLNSGLDFVWAEARSEIGGRMRLSQDALCDGSDGSQCWNLEDGANWVSGAEGNPLFELVWEYDLEHRQMNWGSVSFYDLVGRKKIQKNKLPYGPFESAYNCLTTHAFECKENPQDTLDCGLSAREYMKKYCEWDPTSPADNLKRAVEYYTLDWEQASDPDQIGQLGYPLWPYGYDFQSKDFLIEDGDGYKKVAESYAEGIVPCYNTKIINVDWNAGSSGDPQYPVTVHAEGGGSCDVKAVISTLPASYMLHPSKVGLFSPTPDDTLAALAKTYNINLFYKVFFRFPTKFWDSTDVIFTSGQTVIDGCTAWTNFHSQQGNRYFSGSNILMCTLVTEAVENLTGGTGVLTVDNVDALLEPLRTVYHLRLDDYDYHYNPWKTDEYAFGSYEGFKAGALESDFDDATRPLVNDAGDAVVHWAGSHTCFRHASWVHGALARGHSVAREVINQLQDPSPNLDTTSICTEAPSGGYGNPVFQNARGH